MIAVVQRVAEGRVVVGGRVVGEIGRGVAALVAVVREDSDADVTWMAQKLVGLRIFPNGDKAYDLSVADIDDGGILLVSNFTVAADTHSGRRPSLSPAAPPEIAAGRFEMLVAATRQMHSRVQTGEFGGAMRVELINEGPTTFILDSADRSSAR